MTLPVKNQIICRATSKRTGLPCRNRAVNGALVCRMHGAGGSAETNPVVAKAAQRVEDAQDVIKARLYELHDAAVDAVRSVLEDPDAKAADKLKAADTILNRFVAQKAETKVTTADNEERDLDEEILAAAGVEAHEAG